MSLCQAGMFLNLRMFPKQFLFSWWMLVFWSEFYEPLLFLVQEGKMEAEEFTELLYDELKSTPQPCLVPFLKVKQTKQTLNVLNKTHACSNTSCGYHVSVRQTSCFSHHLTLEKPPCGAFTDIRPTAIHPAGFHLQEHKVVWGRNEQTAGNVWSEGVLMLTSL